MCARITELFSYIHFTKSLQINCMINNNIIIIFLAGAGADGTMRLGTLDPLVPSRVAILVMTVMFLCDSV